MSVDLAHVAVALSYFERAAEFAEKADHINLEDRCFTGRHALSMGGLCHHQAGRPAEAIASFEIIHVRDLQDKIQKADWRAIAWWLAQRFPKRYGGWRQTQEAERAVDEVLGVLDRALRSEFSAPDELGVGLVPHSPYFGPGFLATLHLTSLRGDGFIEVFYMKRAACLWRGRIDVDANGSVEVPQGPGLGCEPDKEVVERYRVS